MNYMKKVALITSILALTPMVAFAQTANLSYFEQILITVGRIVNGIIPILIGVALIVFFWGLIKYIRTSGEGHQEGRRIMVAGLLALFVMVSVWGIVRLAQNVFLGGVGGEVFSPGIPRQGGSSTPTPTPTTFRI